MVYHSPILKFCKVSFIQLQNCNWAWAGSKPQNISIQRKLFQAKSVCEQSLDSFWNYDTCGCEKRNLVARGAGEEPRSSFSECGSYLSSWVRRGNSVLDIGGWILLGSCLALVAILAAATYHYRWETFWKLFLEFCFLKMEIFCYYFDVIPCLYEYLMRISWCLEQ